MSLSRPVHDPPRHSHRHRTSSYRFRLIALVAAILVVLGATGLGVVAWSSSSQLLGVVPQPSHYDITVLGVGGNRVRLPSTDATRRDGTYGLFWPGGRAVVGPVVAQTGKWVVRRILGPTRGLTAGTRVDIDGAPYATPADLGLPYQTVSISGPLGRLPAWYVPGHRSTWVLLVPGGRASLKDGLRLVPTMHRLGLPVLDLSYRNDVHAPPSADHLYHLGATEWTDLQAGVRYALSHGARHLVLCGSSMGGSIVESFLRRSHDSARVRAVVLDAPTLDWDATLDWQVEQSSVPWILKAIELPIIKRVVAWRIGLWDLQPVNQLAAASSFKAPTLIFHGTADTVVPVRTSLAFARARPDLVTLYTVPGAGHMQSWNLNPPLYERRLTVFLKRVLE